MRYLLGGYYGMRNVGDDVLLYVALAETARVDREASFTVISELPELTPPGTRVRIVPGGRRFENVRQMLRHDVWLFGGGGLLQDGSPRAAEYLERLAGAARAVKALGRRIVLLGIGVGPLTTDAGRQAARRLLEHADLVTVRDEESRALARTIAPACEIDVTADLAFLFPRHAPIGPVHGPDGRKRLGLSLLPFASSVGRAGRNDEAIAVVLADTLRGVLERHPEWDLTLFEFFSGSSTYGDARVLQLVRDRIALPGRVNDLAYTGDFMTVFTEMKACDAFIGMRFHSCLLAHVGGVPCLMLSYHPKSESLASRLGLADDAVLPLLLLLDSHVVGARIEALLTDGAKFRPTVSCEPLIAEAERNFARLSTALPARPRRPHYARKG